MHLLIKAMLLAGAAAVGVFLARKPAHEESSQDPVECESKPDACDAELTTEAAYVSAMVRAMDPLSLNPASVVTFTTYDGTELEVVIRGEGGLHVAQHDAGFLTMNGDVFVSFEKENGEIIGAMYYVPVQADGETNE